MSDATPTEEGNRSPSLGGRVEEICDRFEAACKAGRRPPIEDYLGEVPEAGQTALFRELLELELAYRRRAGERPTPEEYQCRFREHVAVIETVFGAAPPPRAGADHNLLFGVLAPCSAPFPEQPVRDRSLSSDPDARPGGIRACLPRPRRRSRPPRGDQSAHAPSGLPAPRISRLT